MEPQPDLFSAPDARVQTESGPTAKTAKITLSTKGLLTFAGLVVYVAAIGLFVAHDRQVLLHIFQQMERVHDTQQSLVKVNAAVAHSIVELQYLLNSKNTKQVYNYIQVDIAPIKAGLPELKQNHPEIIPNVLRFERRATELDMGLSVEKLEALRDSAQELNAQLEKLETVVEGKGDLLAREYRNVNHNITQVALMMGLFGIVLFGALVTVFFTRLASDIHKLEARAAAIVSGYRGKPLEVTRRDEVGGLMRAVNGMQSELLRWEQKKLISWQQRFHRERMAAVGSLAAAVAHEISNPISSISGIAQHTIERIRSHDRPDDDTLCDRAGLIVEQTERIALIVRQIAEFSAPRSPEGELLDVNQLVQTTCNFMRYDKRFRGIDVVLELAPANNLPAAFAVADHLTQVLMNLLINAADAMDGLAGRKPTVRLSTRHVDGEIILSVSDNGQGMDADVLSRAFEESYTTKPAGKGRGIGLYLCKMLLEEMGGRIALQSAVGAGTTAQVYLQLQRSQAGSR